jgi:hypothetical protein
LVQGLLLQQDNLHILRLLQPQELELLRLRPLDKAVLSVQVFLLVGPLNKVQPQELELLLPLVFL